MGQFASAAKAGAITGPLTVTDEDGFTQTFPNEAAAEKVHGGKTVEHRRGGFFVKTDDRTPKLVAKKPK